MTTRYEFVHVRGDLYRRVERKAVVAAYDNAEGLTGGGRKISPQRAARVLRFLHGRLNDADFDRAAEWVAGLIDEKLVEGDDGYRGNGHGHS
jgi:hypothetical protein